MRSYETWGRATPKAFEGPIREAVAAWVLAEYGAELNDWQVERIRFQYLCRPGDMTIEDANEWCLIGPLQAGKSPPGEARHFIKPQPPRYFVGQKVDLQYLTAAANARERAGFGPTTQFDWSAFYHYRQDEQRAQLSLAGVEIISVSQHGPFRLLGAEQAFAEFWLDALRRRDEAQAKLTKKACALREVAVGPYLGIQAPSGDLWNGAGTSLNELTPEKMLEAMTAPHKRGEKEWHADYLAVAPNPEWEARRKARRNAKPKTLLESLLDAGVVKRKVPPADAKPGLRPTGRYAEYLAEKSTPAREPGVVLPRHAPINPNVKREVVHHMVTTLLADACAMPVIPWPPKGCGLGMPVAPPIERKSPSLGPVAMGHVSFTCADGHMTSGLEGLRDTLRSHLEAQVYVFRHFCGLPAGALPQVKVTIAEQGGYDTGPHVCRVDFTVPMGAVS